MYACTMYVHVVYSRTSIIRNLIYLAWQFSLEMGMHVNNCYHGHRNVYLLRMRRCPHALLFINLSG